MSRKSPTCPVCGQELADPSIEARVRHNLEKRDAQRAIEFKRKEARLRADLARERAQVEKVAAEKARRAFDAKVRDLERQQKVRLEATSAKAREEERRRNGRLLEQARKQAEEYRRKLEQMSSDERGEIGEAEIVTSLQRAFPGDLVARLGKTRGSADIRHEVRDQGRTCGVIVYEVKNTGTWAGAAVTQARRSLALYRAAQAVLVSNAFPAGQKYVAIQKDVFIVHPTIVVGVVHALRQVIIVRSSASGSHVERERKAEQLLHFVKGEDFRRSMMTVADAVTELQGLQTRERQAHARVWETQTSLLRAIEDGHTVLQSRIAQIVSGAPLMLLGDEADAPRSATG